MEALVQTPTPLCIFLASYHITSVTVSPGTAPCSVPDHITALSHAASLRSTHLWSAVLLSLFLAVSFSPVWTITWCLVTPPHHLSSLSSTTRSLMWPTLLPYHCHQQAGVLDIQPFIKAWQPGPKVQEAKHILKLICFFKRQVETDKIVDMSSCQHRRLWLRESINSPSGKQTPK